MSYSWHLTSLKKCAALWLAKIRARTNQRVSENSVWWSFLFEQSTCMESWLRKFITGVYHFAPIQQYNFSDEVVQCWEYADRMVLTLILTIIKPTFRYLFSVRCYHLQGPSGVKVATRVIHTALKKETYRYVIRADIKGYYASISRQKLTQQLHQEYQDPRLQHYFDQIVNHAVCHDGEISLPSHGIPRRSSLSPFFGALYLRDLDRAYEKVKGVQYFRFMDDILILAETRNQYKKAKKTLYQILNSLELTLSPRKTWMGKLTHGFHFLGVAFEVSQNPQTKFQVTVRIHPRSCARALQRVQSLAINAVNPAAKQRYLSAWSAWWADALQTMGISALLLAWFIHAKQRGSPDAWLARGLIRYFRNPSNDILDALFAG